MSLLKEHGITGQIGVRYNVCAITAAGAEHSRLESHIHVTSRAIIVSQEGSSSEKMLLL